MSAMAGDVSRGCSQIFDAASHIRRGPALQSMMKMFPVLFAYALSACVAPEGDELETDQLESELDIGVDPLPPVNCTRPNLKTTIVLQDRYGRNVDSCSTAMYQMIFYVANTGCVASGATTFKFQRKDGTWLTLPLDSIPAGTTKRTVTTTMTWNGQNDYALSAKADPSNLVVESNESDNAVYWNCIL